LAASEELSCQYLAWIPTQVFVFVTSGCRLLVLFGALNVKSVSEDVYFVPMVAAFAILFLAITNGRLGCYPETFF